MTVTLSKTAGPDIFQTPPNDPIALVRDWLTAARAAVRDPGAFALATVDEHGNPTSRTVQIVEIEMTGLVFTSHALSRKGRDLNRDGRASGVLYWREEQRQVTLAGRATRLPDARSDRMWSSRPPGTHPMSVVSTQSAPLTDEEALRASAHQLTGLGPLPRPDGWCGYLLVPDAVEFWQGSPDRLHRRLHYTRTAAGWTTSRLQP